jgi:hypothetical protein
VIHYGVAAGHIPARVKLKHGVDVGHQPTREVYGGGGLRAWLVGILQRFYRPTAWAQEPADADEIAELVAILAEGLDQGGIGIGLIWSDLCQGPRCCVLGPVRLRQLLGFGRGRQRRDGLLRRRVTLIFADCPSGAEPA